MVIASIGSDNIAANEVACEVEKKSVLDAALIAAAQAVEHYEMTRYGTPDLVGEGTWPERLRCAAPADDR